MNISLEPQQIELLIRLVEAYRSLPSSQRGRFNITDDFNAMHVYIWNEGHEAGGGDVRALPADLDVLAAERAIQFVDKGVFVLLPEGLRAYERIKLAQGQPVQRTENAVRQYLDTERFQAAYPNAHQMWKSAEAKLWGDDSDRELTTIGHLCREALQEFADALIRRAKLDGSHPDKTKTMNRIRAVLERKVASETDRELLESLMAYCWAANGVIQRQEHGAQGQALPLTSHSARLCVFHTLLVMYEVDRIMESAWM